MADKRPKKPTRKAAKKKPARSAPVIQLAPREEPDSRVSEYPSEAPSFPEIPDMKKRAYLAALCRTGRFGAAAKIAGVDVKTAYNWRKGDEAFAAAEDMAQSIGGRLGEDEAWRRAIEGVNEPVYQGGILVGYKRVLSDTLLIFMLKGALPEKYRERFDHKHSGIGPDSPEGVLLRMAGQPLPTSTGKDGQD